MRAVTIGVFALVLAGCGASMKRVESAQLTVLRDPQQAEAWVALGDAYRRARLEEEAGEAYGRALALAPDNDQIRGRLGSSRSAEIQALERQALADPANDELWGDLADAYLAAGDRETALRHYQFALSIDPDDSEWQRKVVESVDPADLDGLLALLRDSTDDERIGDLADALRAAGREPEACETYLRAFEIDPGDSEWQGALEPCEGVGDIFDAAADRAVASGDDERIGDAADALLARGNESRACELYRQALSLDPDDSEWIEKVGRCDGGGFEPTDGVVGGVVGGLGSREPENDSLVALGREALARGDRAGAITHFEAALLDAPADRDARTALMALTGRTLIAILESAAARAAQDDELLGDLADAYLEAGRRDDAVRAYERAAAIDPDDSEWQRKLDVLVPSRLSPR